MAKSKHVRLFVNVARRHWDDAVYLRDDKRNVSAAYLAGYVVECLLKAMILTKVPEHKQPAVIHEFRGRWGHDFTWLRQRYGMAGGARAPKEISFDFDTVSEWDSDMRYNPSVTFEGDIEQFLAAVGRIRSWALARI